jgi:hypothetical protein
LQAGFLWKMGLPPGNYKQAGQPSIHNDSWREQELLQAEICRGVPVQLLSHAWKRSAQVWQQSAKANADLGLARTTTARIKAKRIERRSKGLR